MRKGQENLSEHGKTIGKPIGKMGKTIGKPMGKWANPS